MNKIIIFFFWLSIPLFCMADNLPRVYEYDAAGNRILRKTIELNPAPPPDSTEIAPIATENFEIEYYVEKIAQIEMKIYPNPTTENITLEIANMEKLEHGIFKLYSLTGQLLQEQQVHSATSHISLANLPKGTYMLKVHINHKTEDWKIIKN